MEVPQIVSQPSRVFSRSIAPMVKQWVKVPKSRSRALRRTVEQIDDIPATGGDSSTSSTSRVQDATSSGFEVLHTFFPWFKKKCNFSSQADAELPSPWTPKAHELGTSRRTSDVSGDTCVVDDDDEVWCRVSVGRLALVITWPEHRLRGFSEWTRLAMATSCSKDSTCGPGLPR